MIDSQVDGDRPAFGGARYVRHSDVWSVMPHHPMSIATWTGYFSGFFYFLKLASGLQVVKRPRH
jgi:hypothetical protein